MTDNLKTDNVDTKRDVNRTVLCLTAAQTKCIMLMKALPRANAMEVGFRVPVYPDNSTGPGRLYIIGGCQGKEPEACPTCEHKEWQGFSVEFSWVGNRFSEGRVDRKRFKSISQTVAEIERRIGD